MNYRIRPAPKDDGFHRVRAENGTVLGPEGVSEPERSVYWTRRENDGEVVITPEADAPAEPSTHTQE
jgi:hypothetical protein